MARLDVLCVMCGRGGGRGLVRPSRAGVSVNRAAWSLTVVRGVSEGS